jgi:hypothetical protein
MNISTAFLGRKRQEWVGGNVWGNAQNAPQEARWRVSRVPGF